MNLVNVKMLACFHNKPKVGLGLDQDAHFYFIITLIAKSYKQ